MLTLDELLNGVPEGLRAELKLEHSSLLSNFYEGRWTPAELHAGRFCEVVYSILKGRASGQYPQTATKPQNFVQACLLLENETELERGLRILVARALPPLYEIRNNRGVGHVGGDVDSNFMDASYSVNVAGWIMAELIRVFHCVNPDVASQAVSQFTQIKIPTVWTSDGMRRVLRTDLKLEEQCLLLIASSPTATFSDIQSWTEAKNSGYLRKVLMRLHSRRFIEASDMNNTMILLPPGADRVRELVAA